MGIALRNRTAWTIFGQGLYVLTQLGILILLARIAGVADVGYFGLASAIVTPIFWLFDLGLRTNKTTDADERFTLNEFLTLRLATTGIAYILIAIAAVLYLDTAEGIAIALVFGAAKGVETISEICYGVYERKGEMRPFAISMLSRGLGSLLLFGGVLVATQSSPLAFVAQLAVWLMVLVAHDLPLARRLSDDRDTTVHWRRLMDVARSSWALGVSQFVAALQTALPRFIIDRALGLEAVGIFTALAYLLQASSMLMTAISRSIMGHLADLSRNSRKGEARVIVAKYARPCFIGGLLLLPGVWFLGAPILALVFGPEFAGRGVLVTFIYLAALFRGCSILYQATTIAGRRFVSIAWIRVIDLAIIVASVLAGLALGGLEGIAAGLAFSSFAILVLLWLLHRQLTSRP